MFNIVTQKIGKTAKGEEEKIKKMIVDGHERGVCKRYGGHIPKHLRGNAGKGDRNRCRKVVDLEALCARAAKNLWPRDKDGNLIGDN